MAILKLLFCLFVLVLRLKLNFGFFKLVAIECIQLLLLLQATVSDFRQLIFNLLNVVVKLLNLENKVHIGP